MCSCNNNLSKDIERAQTVRLLDMFIIGPALIALGIIPKLPILAKIILVLIGGGTILYNGFFYFKYKKIFS